MSGYPRNISKKNQAFKKKTLRISCKKGKSGISDLCWIKQSMTKPLSQKFSKFPRENLLKIVLVS